MNEVLFFLASSFWAGAAHAATPGHGKTIAAAYIVGARGKPIDALILGIFVTLSHTSGIVVVGVLASIGSTWLRPQRVEAYMGLIVGVVVIALGLWMLWTHVDLLALAMGGAPILKTFHPIPNTVMTRAPRTTTITRSHRLRCIITCKTAALCGIATVSEKPTPIA